MRVFLLVALLTTASTAQAHTLSRDDILSRAKSAGYLMVSKAEISGATWDLWASKEGIVYEVRFDARDGALLTAMPIDAND